MAAVLRIDSRELFRLHEPLRSHEFSGGLDFRGPAYKLPRFSSSINSGIEAILADAYCSSNPAADGGGVPTGEAVDDPAGWEQLGAGHGQEPHAEGVPRLTSATSLWDSLDMPADGKAMLKCLPSPFANPAVRCPFEGGRPGGHKPAPGAPAPPEGAPPPTGPLVLGPRVKARIRSGLPAELDAGNVAGVLHKVLTAYRCACNTQLSLLPLLWRSHEPPHAPIVNLGLRTQLVEVEVTLPLVLYTSYNPRTVTTGVPARVTHAARQPAEAAVVTRRAAALAASQQPRGPAPHVAALLESLHRDRDSFTVQEVFLIRKHPDTGGVEEVWHCQGPVGSSTVVGAPEWPGTWLVDVVVRVADEEEGTIWLKACNRRLADTNDTPLPGLHPGGDGEAAEAAEPSC